MVSTFLGVVFCLLRLNRSINELQGQSFHLFRCGFHLFRCGFRLIRLHRRFNESQGSVLTIPSQVWSTQFWGWCQPFQTYFHVSCPMEKWIHKVCMLHKIFYNLLHDLSESHKVTSLGKNVAVKLRLQCSPWILWEWLSPVVMSSVPVWWLSM